MIEQRPQTGSAKQQHGHRKLKLFGREFHMPRSRPVRIVIGVLLIFFGFLGFLPILGFWMIPLGLLILSYEFAAVRRLRRRLIVWWERRRRSRDKRPDSGNA